MDSFNFYILLIHLTDAIKLWKNQMLKFIRLIRDKIFEIILLSEIYIVCKSKNIVAWLILKPKLRQTLLFLKSKSDLDSTDV